LQAGAAVVIKPSEFTPLGLIEVVEAWKNEIGGPDVLDCVQGIGETGEALVDEVDFIQFTGSDRSGRKVMKRAADTLTPVSLELGGKDPMIVLADADLDRAANAATYGGMMNSGQICISVERIYVEEPAYDEFVQKLTKEVSGLRQGADGKAFAKDVGAFQTLVELRADIHTKLEKMLKDRAESALAEQIVEKLNEKNPLDVPPSLVEQQCRMMEMELLQNARRAGQRISADDFAKVHGQVHADAEKKVRAGLLMGAIAKKLEVKVTDEDIQKGLEELSAETGKNVAKLRAEYNEPQRRQILVGMILEDKVLDLIEGKANIRTGEPLATATATEAAAASSDTKTA